MSDLEDYELDTEGDLWMLGIVTSFQGREPQDPVTTALDVVAEILEVRRHPTRQARYEEQYFFMKKTPESVLE